MKNQKFLNKVKEVIITHKKFIDSRLNKNKRIKCSKIKYQVSRYVENLDRILCSRDRELMYYKNEIE